MASNPLSVLPSQIAPYSQEAEEALLGAVMTDPFVFRLLREVVSAGDFYILRHSYIWQAFAAVIDSGVELDFVSLVDALRAAERLTDVGGSGYLLHLVNSTPSSTHADTYAELVRRAAVRRRLLTHGDEVKALALDEHLSVEKVVGDAERSWVKVRDTSLRIVQEPIQVTADRFMADIEDRMRDPEKRFGLLTGWKKFNALTGGLINGEVTVFGGRPRMGKSAIMLNLLLFIAKMRLPVGIVSLEMKRAVLLLRFAAIEAGLDMRLIREGNLTTDEHSRLRRAINVIRSLPIFIDDPGSMTAMQLDGLATRWKFKEGIVLLCVDYVQLMSGGDFRENQRVAELTFITRSLKNLAGTLNIPILEGAQLNRDLEKRDDKRPQLSDLRESGSIENDADLVHLLYRDRVYHPNTTTPGALEVITAKHRNGPEGTTMLYFEAKSNQITDSVVNTYDLNLLGVPQKRTTYIPTKGAKVKAAYRAGKEEETQEAGNDD